MLFFADTKNKQRKVNSSRPKTIQEIKKLQNFVKHYREEPGKSLNASIKGMAKRDESFNEFLRAFKAKNEQKWANIIDMTQAEQEELLLAKSPEYRRNEMVMLEEFRRRKNMKNYYDLMREKRRRFDNWHGRDERKVNYMEFDKEG